MQQKLEMGQMVDEKKNWTITFARELKKEGIIAAPMVAVTALQYLLQLVSMIMVGHLDQLSLSSVAIAISLTNVTGFSLLMVNHGVAREVMQGMKDTVAEFFELPLEEKNRISMPSDDIQGSGHAYVVSES